MFQVFNTAFVTILATLCQRTHYNTQSRVYNQAHLRMKTGTCTLISDTAMTTYPGFLQIRRTCFSRLQCLHLMSSISCLSCPQDVEVKVRSSHVLVKINGKILVNDELLNRCDPDMSRWEIRGTRLVLVLQKEANSTIPWPNVFVKDCKTHFDLADVL